MEKIELRNITKSIDKKMILDGVSMELESGNLYGIMGANGSGKTMLLRVMAGLLSIDDGEILCDGEAVKRLTSRISVGLTLENIGLYDDMSIKENLIYYGKINHTVNMERINRAIERVGMGYAKNKKFRKYSLGMKQRAVIAQAIMDEPELLLFDEPTNGLDDDGKKLMLQIVREEVERGACVVVVSHELEYFEDLMTYKYHMKEGKIS